MLELLMGFWIGRATKGANPLVVVTSFFIALALLALMVGMCVEMWHFSPQAVHVVEWSGIGRCLPFLDLHLHDVGVQDAGAIIMELPSRIVLCSLALLVIGVLGVAAISLLNMVTIFVVKAVKLLLSNASA
jgi:hypothetical protein